MDKTKELMDIINNSSNIVFFGGAGVSTASNIPDFRGSNGLYKHSPEEIISHTFFMEHTKEFFEFYFSKMIYLKAKPNECHKFLYALEKVGKLRAIVTQNIDNLHQEAGNKNVIELHGSTKRNYCMKCGKYYDISDEVFKKINYHGIPRCSCGGIIKPDVVLYEEQLNEDSINQALNVISKCDVLIVAGTSLVVYPAASFIKYFNGRKLVVINLGHLDSVNNADLAINGKVEDYLNMDNFNKYIK